ncbi:MAG TPA: GlxA family transcriptional regulator [Microvirga sp.]|jgi:transcriptional regulator GlxA family with amidase domain|nr:GlxA family transcriptional regulator [Microvirga sp.]
MRMPGEAPGPPSATRTIGLLLVPDFSMIAFTAAIEPLRLANRAAGRALYEWRLYSADGRPVQASNGIEIGVSGSFGSIRELNAAIVCAGLDVQHLDHRDLMATLRRLSSFGAVIGAVCTGTYVLARAGLLEGYRATIHWENHASLKAEFPDLAISQELFEVDRNRLTCAGGTAALDMMLSLILRDHGPGIAAQVTDQLIHHRVREAAEHQRMDLRARLDVAHPKVLAAVALMERSVENPLSCAALAARAGCSTRQLERLFCKYLGHSPTRHYVAVRLERARDLLRQTSLPVITVATACGFASASHFSKSYVEHFGCTPSAERKRRAGATASAA